ncbi:LysR family transcriptional regulator [Actinomadura rubrobrunea]|uniref:LysR family transcriptional regulator n=1 Tax=Actinomadura rubrobrunea TaxID=115335 RepID=A0A9W6Q350_9ACTN|nr:SDR family oxidoreductase [Actinomadura rubrobrunea]GLW67656.1 LysR family transcriptional regulator [Actinomadura rubrobrunea]
MRFAVIGGTGLIGSQVVRGLDLAGHEAVPLSPRTGVDVLTGEGLDDALKDAETVVNLTNSPTFDEASLAFFQTSMTNLLAAARRSGAGHVVILSIVGADKVPGLVYFRAKTLQEEALRTGAIPYSIVRATQFMEFIGTILSWTAEDDTVRLPRTLLQPIASADVAAAVAAVAAGPPLNGARDVAGPDTYPLDELGRITLAARGDPRSVITDDSAGMFAAVHGDVLTVGEGADVAPTHYADWLEADLKPRA